MSGERPGGSQVLTARPQEARDRLERRLPEALARPLRLPEDSARPREARDRLAVRPTAAADFLPAEAAAGGAADSLPAALPGAVADFLPAAVPGGAADSLPVEAAADSPEAEARPAAEVPDAVGDNNKNSGYKIGLLWILLKSQKVVPTS